MCKNKLQHLLANKLQMYHTDDEVLVTGRTTELEIKTKTMLFGIETKI